METQEIIDYVVQHVSAQDYYAQALPDLEWSTNGTDEMRILCPLHDDKNSKSLNLNAKSGFWKCHGCGAGGKTIVAFEAALHKVSNRLAAKRIFSRHVHPTIPSSLIDEWHIELLETRSALDYLTGRGISLDVIKFYKVGYDGNRITFPVRNELGLYINAKKLCPNKKQIDAGAPKMICHKTENEERKFGSPITLWPISVLANAAESRQVVITEGEIDTLSLLSVGIPAVTSTGGAGAWPQQHTKMLRGHDVVISYDTDVPGTLGGDKVERKLFDVAKTLRRYSVPKKWGKDINDVFQHKESCRKKEFWLEQFKTAKLIVANEHITTVNSETALEQIPLHEASESRHINQKIFVDALVVSKSSQPYAIPKLVRFRRIHNCGNLNCKAMPKGQEYRDKLLKLDDRMLLNFVEHPDNVVNEAVKKLAGIKCPECEIRVQVMERENVELAVISSADTSPNADSHVRRYAYVVGHGLAVNRAYKFQGMATNHPKDQSVVHVFEKATPLQNRIETFHLTRELQDQLKQFRPTVVNLPIMAQLNRIADWQRKYITKIHQRPELHIGIDLVYHSADSFYLNKDFVHRGMLDFLILGDSSCGKGQVLENLIKYYGIGSLASGENCTKAGLTGGVEKGLNGRFFIKWGLFPMNHGGFVGIDEMSNLTVMEIGGMSRIRSEGIVEINKIETDRAPAKCRMIWLSNPRHGKKVSSYSHGVHAIVELIGAAEDIRRFDAAIIVANNEVPIDLINSLQPVDTRDQNRFNQQGFRSLVLWAWSRQPDQVKINEKVSSLIYATARELSKTYSSQIPLVQGENIRIKVAKLAVAIAARVYSADKTGEIIVVKQEHVNCAKEFLDWQYSKPCFGYAQYSAREENSVEPLTREIIKIFEKLVGSLNVNRKNFLEGLMNIDSLTTRDISDHLGVAYECRAVLQQLITAKCIYRDNAQNTYHKTPGFTQYLKNQVSDYTKRML